MLNLLLALQAFHVLFLLLHDWIPLGSLNNVAAVRAANPAGKLLIGTLISTSFFLFYGELRAWWIPYFGAPQPERAARYQTMFANTHSFLPARNGIPLNTLHVLLHAFTLATLVVIGLVMTT